MVCLADADFLGYCCRVAVNLVSPLAGLCQSAAAADPGRILEPGWQRRKDAQSCHGGGWGLYSPAVCLFSGIAPYAGAVGME